MTIDDVFFSYRMALEEVENLECQLFKLDLQNVTSHITDGSVKTSLNTSYKFADKKHDKDVIQAKIDMMKINIKMFEYLMDNLGEDNLISARYFKQRHIIGMSIDKISNYNGVSYNTVKKKLKETEDLFLSLNPIRFFNI